MKIALIVVLACACVAAALPFPQPEDKKDNSGWVVKADTTNNGGTVVRAEGSQKWDITNDGKVQGEVHGHWERVYGGPSNGQRDRGVGGSIGGSWGK